MTSMQSIFRNNKHVKDMIRAKYMEGRNKSVVQMQIECDHIYSSCDSFLKFSVPVEDLSYEMICFASTKLVVDDGTPHAIELHSAHDYRHSPVGASRLVSAPGVDITIFCRCTTRAPSMRYCTLTVHAVGTWPQVMKSWNELSDLEVENRVFMKFLYCLGDLLSGFNCYNTLIDGDTILEKERRGLPLSDTEQRASENLQAIKSLMSRV